MKTGILYAISAAALFGLSVPFAKYLLGDISPVLLAGILYFSSGLGLASVMVVRRVARGTTDPVAWPQRTDLPWLIAAILFGGVLGPLLLMLGLQQTSGTAASLLLNLEAVFTTILAWFAFKENFDRRIAIGMALITGGCVLLSWPAHGDYYVGIGPLLVTAACFCWGLDNNLTRRISSNDALILASIKGFAAGTTNLAIALLRHETLPSLPFIGAASLVGFLGYGLSLTLFILALRALGTARTGAYFSIAPFFGAIFAVGIFQETISVELALGAALIGFGVWLHLTERHDHEHHHNLLIHTHAHKHDEHHQHSHSEGDANEPHTHEHVHEPMTHSHPHYPDIHHRHAH